MTRTLCSFTAVISVLLASAAANAQTEEDFYEYSFVDEDVLGASLDALGDTIRPPMRPVRTLLIRPRISFVAPLLKSVEHLSE